MDITFSVPNTSSMLDSILTFQTEDESAFWSEPLYHFYPQLDRSLAQSLPASDRVSYIRRTMESVYAEQLPTLQAKCNLYAAHWQQYHDQVNAALSDAFDCSMADLFNDLHCHVSLNPIQPRYLTERQFDVFCLNSERGALGTALHELVHFAWFHVWNQVFADDYTEYERPSLKWILSEMVVESIMRDERLSSINPYFPREHGGCVYPYFFTLMIDGVPALDTLDAMYRTLPIRTFMQESFAWCQANESLIRQHIAASE